MTRSTKTVDAIAREHDEEALGVIRDIMIDPFTEAKDRIRAAEAILDRGHGKAAQAIIAVPAGRRQAQQLAAMEDAALLAVIREQPLPRLSAPQPEVEPVIEADFEPVVEAPRRYSSQGAERAMKALRKLADPNNMNSLVTEVVEPIDPLLL
jgi:hypothetical protein